MTKQPEPEFKFSKEFPTRKGFTSWIGKCRNEAEKAGLYHFKVSWPADNPKYCTFEAWRERPLQWDADKISEFINV